MGRNRSDLIIFFGKRLVEMLPVLLGIIVITFVFTHMAVQDPCAVWLPRAKPDQIRACIITNHLDKPLPDQFWTYLSTLLSGDWGADSNGVPALQSIASGFPATLELVLASLFIMTVIGIPLGVVAASGSGRWPDHLVRILYLSGWATPTYLGGVILAIGIGPVLGLPSQGNFSPGVLTFPEVTHMSVLDALIALNFPAVVDAVSHLILPATALALLNLGIATRMTRTSMLEVLPLDYIKTAKMKGLSDFIVLYKHALRNSLISTVTILGITAGVLLSGTVVIEYIFQWPGIGLFAFNSITGYSFSATIAVVIVFAVGVVIANLIADLLYGILDPRVEWR